MPERSRNSLEFYLLRLLSEKALAPLFVEKDSIQMVEPKSLYLSPRTGNKPGCNQGIATEATLGTFVARQQ